MGRFKIMGLALAVVLAVGALSATSADAAKANLVLREGGEHLYEGLDPVLADGAPIEASFQTPLGACETTKPIVGEMKANSSPLVAFYTSPGGGKQEAETSCADEYEGIKDEMSLLLQEVPLSSKGTVKKIKGSLIIIIWGPYGSEKECGYSFNSLTNAKGTIQLPAPGKASEAVVKGTMHSVGSHQNKTCPKKETITFTLTLADNGGFPLETTLEG